MSRRSLEITTQAQAEKILRQTPGARRTIYSAGKYKWSGSSKDYVGRREENVCSDIRAIYVERRTDADGPYAKVMCITV